MACLQLNAESTLSIIIYSVFHHSLELFLSFVFLLVHVHTFLMGFLFCFFKKMIYSDMYNYYSSNFIIVIKTPHSFTRVHAIVIILLKSLLCKKLQRPKGSFTQVCMRQLIAICE